LSLERRAFRSGAPFLPQRLLHPARGPPGEYEGEAAWRPPPAVAIASEERLELTHAGLDDARWERDIVVSVETGDSCRQLMGAGAESIPVFSIRERSLDKLRLGFKCKIIE
jgi:hypothetical protein